MIDKNSRILRDAIRKAEWVEVRWKNGFCGGQFATMDTEFAKDVANAYARMCDRHEHKINTNNHK